MTTARDRVVRWGGARLSRRLSRSLPIIGAVVALATVVGTMRRKGLISGAFDTALNAIPFVGAAKNAVEMARGRDFFPDRRFDRSVRDVRLRPAPGRVTSR